MSTLKVTNIAPQSGTNVYLTGSLTISETLIAKEVRTELTQSVTLFQSGSTQFGDTADDTHAFTGDVTVTGALGITGYADLSASLSANDTSISALQTDSASFSTRLTTEEANVDALQVDSASFSTRLTTAESELGNTLLSSSAQIADDISGSFVAASSSIATDIDALQTDSGSFSTRVTDLESFSSSLDATYATDAQLNTATASLSSSLATDIATRALTANISGSFTSTSSSIATDIASLVTDSGSFSTRVTDVETLYFVKRHRTENIVLPGSYTGVTIDFTTGSLDYGSTDAMWSSGTDRFTPTVAGLWHFKAQADVYGGASAENGINIYKNGTIEAGMGNIGSIRPQVSAHVYMNGSTDYIEIQAYSQNSATRGQNASTCFFEAKLIKAD